MMDQTLSQVSLQTKLKKEEEDILKDICTSNGFSFSQLQLQTSTSTQMEMFFSGMPKLLGLSNFPNLKELCIMGQSISKIENLSHCPQLQELWLCEMQIKKIEGLENLKRLRRLFLYDNKIKKIENLSQLPELETLWLNINQIKDIECLASLKTLKEVNLAQNNITKMGNSLNTLSNLVTLELSGNKIFSFKDITYLQKLPNLRELGLKSPGYPSNPVGLLCNYSTHVLYHLPNLDRLDQLCFSDSAIKDLSEATVEKKKMYYNMRCKTIWRHFTEIEVKMKELKDFILKSPHNRIRTLAYIVKGLERELRELESPRNSYSGSGTESDKDAQDDQDAKIHEKMAKIKTKIAALSERIVKREKKAKEVEEFYNEGVEQLRQTSNLQAQRLIIELEMGGNIRFEDGTVDDVWFTACHDLILSRFCAADFNDCGVTGVKIHRITRLHNRLLRIKFEEALSAQLEDGDVYYPPNKSTSFKKLLEYLFWIYDPDIPGGAAEPQRVVEDGFMDPSTQKQLGKEAAVPLSNSISLADRFRIKHCVKQAKAKNLKDPCPFRHGQIIIAKVYIGKSAQYSESKPVERQKYSKQDSVFKPRNEDDEKTTLRNLGLNKVSGSTTMTHTADLTSSRAQCECSNRQSEWFIFNHHLAMPEYIVDFEYVTRLSPISPFLSLEETMKASMDKDAAFSEDLENDDDILKLDPQLTHRLRIAQVTNATLLQVGGVQSLELITVLDISGNGLSRVKGLSSLPNLQKLFLSFNELVRLDDLSQMTIDYLDTSFNKLTTLEGFKNMSRLKYLDVTWNRLQHTREDVSILRKHCPILATLDCRHNDWQKELFGSDGLRLRAIGRIKTLTMLNGLPVLEQESAAALRMAAGSRISQVSLLSHSRTDVERPRSLSLSSAAQVLSVYSRNRPDRASDQDNVWLGKVTTLNLDSQHISKISNVERLQNLRYASFNDNDITKIEGLDCCVNLEELSLEENCLSKVEGISKLVNIRRLTLGHNFIQTLENCGLDKLIHLQYFSIESNKLKSLIGLQRNKALVELYVGNNLIINLREIFVLKNLPYLVILDLFGNPVVSTSDNYRLFVIYHLRSLKALDGTAIDPSECNLAKDAFGGRLTQDFVAERLNNSNFIEIKEMDFPNCNIRSVDLGAGDAFLNLRSVNLEHNSLTSFSGLINLVNLRVLCLNHNHIECVVPRGKQHSSASKAPRSVYSTNLPVVPAYSAELHTPLLESLEVLHLAYNGIKDMAALQLNRLPSLKALFLHGNEITQVSGLEMLQDLRELVLDRNKIRTINEYSFASLWNLQELHLEENRLKELSNLGCLENLQRLFLGMNRIQEMSELEKLEPLRSLVELSVVSNAVSRRMLHRPLLVYRMPNLHIIDGIPITDEERAKSDMYFIEQQNALGYFQQPQPPISVATDSNLPGIGNYKSQVPVKVTNMQLMSGPFSTQNWTGTLQLSDDVLQGRRALSNERRLDAQVQGSNSSKLSSTLTYQHGSGQDKRHSSQALQYRPTFGNAPREKKGNR